MARIWQDFRGGTDEDPVTIESMDPGGIPASFIIIDNASGPGPDIAYDEAAGQRFGYPMGVLLRWSGTPTYMRWDAREPDVSARYVMRFPIVFDSAPPVDVVHAQIRSTSGQIMGEAGVDPSSRIYFNSQTTTMPIPDRFTATLGTVYWVQLAVTAGTTDTDGILEARIEDEAGAELFTYSDTATGTGTVPIQHFRVGLPGTNPDVTSEVVSSTAGLVMGDLDTGWWPHLSPTNIAIRPISDRPIGPGEQATLTAELWNAESGATWTWSQVSGPDLDLTSSGEVASMAGPDRWSSSSATPDAGPIGLSPAVVEVTAVLGDDTAPPVRVLVDVLPQITWTRTPAGTWVGGKVAPWCEETP